MDDVEPPAFSTEELCNRLLVIMGSETTMGMHSFHLERQTITEALLLCSLIELSSHDSLIHDFMTTGQLGKFLSRWDVIEKTGDLRVAGLPHPVFDELSRMEVVDQVQRGLLYEGETKVLEMPEVQRMMVREGFWNMDDFK